MWAGRPHSLMGCGKMPQLRTAAAGLGLCRGCGRGDFWCEMHDLVAAVALALFHGVHHGVHHGAVVALIGVENFSPCFADFGDARIAIHGLGLQRVRWVCRWSVPDRSRSRHGAFVHGLCETAS